MNAAQPDIFPCRFHKEGVGKKAKAPVFNDFRPDRALIRHKCCLVCVVEFGLRDNFCSVFGSVTQNGRRVFIIRERIKELIVFKPRMS